MKKVILLLLSACSIFACTHTPKWELVWEDNFDGAEPDTSVWSRIPRGKPDWQILLSAKTQKGINIPPEAL